MKVAVKDSPEVDKIDEILTRGVVEFIDPENKFKEKLKNNPKKIVIKYGIDPTRPDIHLGHALCLRKLEELRKLGCKIIFLIGDFTALIGDPSGKSDLRPELELQEVHENMKTFALQAKKVLKNPVLVQNSTWYMPYDDVWVGSGRPLPFFKQDNELLQQYISEREIWEMEVNVFRQFLTLSNIISNLRIVTVDQLIEREMFKKRKKSNKPIYMNEFIYPILQGIDSVVIAKKLNSCDLEIGGTDQHFNMLMGRQIMERSREISNSGIDAQSVITLKILEGTDGKEKMSKSLDNYIGITEKPNDMFGKVMSIPDTSIANYFELCTDILIDDIKKMESDMKAEKVNPRDLKLQLAEEIVEIYHDSYAAKKAKDYFINTFSKKETPKKIKEIFIDEDIKRLTEFLVLSGNATSNSDARRKIEQGGVEIDGKKETDWKRVLDKKDSGSTLKIGKHSFVKVRF